MSSIENELVSSLRFPEGRPAKIAVRIDRGMTRIEKFIVEKIGGSFSEQETIQVGDYRYEIHPRFNAMRVTSEGPDGKRRSLNEASIVHVYYKGEKDNQEQLIERNRVKDNPQGFHKLPGRS